MQLVTIACPVCGCAECAVERQVADRFEVVPGSLYRIVRCRNCSLLYLNPRPADHDLSAFYNVTGYDPFVTDERRVTFAQRVYRFVRKFTVARKARRISRGLAQGARVLDVGCATGEILVQLRAMGFSCCGVEPDPKAAAFARERHGLTVWTGSIEAVPGKADSFDLIVLWHVLEHVSDLKGTVQRLSELLSDTGRIAIAVPNPESYDARVYGDRWVAWDSPRHLYHFDPERITSLFESANLRVERRGAVAFDAFYHCLLSESSGLSGFVRSVWRGSVSFLRGVSGHGGSSELYYVCKK